MDKYFIIADEKFKDWPLLEKTLYDLTGRTNRDSFEFWAYNDIINIWNMMVKYKYWYEVNLKNANDSLDEYIDDFSYIIFNNGKNREIKNILKMLKKERIKPLAVINYN